MNVDVAIIGGGPTGLCFARALAEIGLSVKIIDKQSREALAHPEFDGREIAMTHASKRTLEELGIWSLIPEDEVFPLRNARVMDGLSPRGMMITARDGGRDDQLGYLVANHLIRQAAFDAAMASPSVELLDDCSVTTIRQRDGYVSLPLSNGGKVRARLLVASDNRFSETRRKMGIGAQMHDFGKFMLVCRMAHEQPHDQTAWEWFDYGQTLALLPLKENTASTILTLRPQEAQSMHRMEEQAFNENVAKRYHGRLGEMKLISPRLIYPLVGVYSHRFIEQRFALIGDAAVGMHPVTAHGFNFGLAGVRRLSHLIAQASAQNKDIAASDLLRQYECGHRRETLPLFLATCAVASLYTNDRAPARLLRKAALCLSDKLTPFKRSIANRLTQAV